MTSSVSIFLSSTPTWIYPARRLYLSATIVATATTERRFVLFPGFTASRVEWSTPRTSSKTLGFSQ